MKIKEINLQHYGPLPIFSKKFDDGIHLINGCNESGKTLLIDAVMKMLIGGTNYDTSLERVDQPPSGYVLIEKDGEEFKLDTKIGLEKIMDIDADELRNIFCIRDADLIITDEMGFYERTQDKLTNLRSADLRRIIEAIKVKGRLTPSGAQLADSKVSNYAKSVFTETRRLIAQITDYIKQAKDGHVEELESELMNRKSDFETYNENLETLEKAKSKQEFEKIQTDYKALVDADSEFKAFSENEIAELNGIIKNYDENPINKVEIQRKLDLFKTLSLASLGLGALTFIITLFTQIPIVGYLIPILLIIGGGYSLYRWMNINSILSGVEQQEINIISKGKQLGIESDTVYGVKTDLNVLAEANESTKKALYGKQEVVRSFFDIESSETKEIISQASSLLVKLETEIDHNVEIIYSETEYDRIGEEIKTTQAQMEEIDGLLGDHKEKIDDFRTRIADLNYSRFMDSELELLIDNLEALERVVPLLTQLRNRIELDKTAADQAIKIFKELETEEEQKIKELFSKDSSVVENFKNTTNGRYIDVKYDVDSKTIVVERPTGETLEESKLSKGTRDQLYLAIRVALGEKILEGSPGFFILDEAFLSSDETRLKSQVNMLENLSLKGWQIIYLTMKNDAVEAISNVTDNEILTLTPLA